MVVVASCVLVKLQVLFLEQCSGISQVPHGQGRSGHCVGWSERLESHRDVQNQSRVLHRSHMRM